MGGWVTGGDYPAVLFTRPVKLLPRYLVPGFDRVDTCSHGSEDFLRFRNRVFPAVVFPHLLCEQELGHGQALKLHAHLSPSFSSVLSFFSSFSTASMKINEPIVYYLLFP
jgi:hypothetical protein